MTTPWKFLGKRRFWRAWGELLRPRSSFLGGPYSVRKRNLPRGLHQPTALGACSCRTARRCWKIRPRCGANQNSSTCPWSSSWSLGTAAALCRKLRCTKDKTAWFRINWSCAPLNFSFCRRTSSKRRWKRCTSSPCGWRSQCCAESWRIWPIWTGSGPRGPAI